MTEYTTIKTPLGFVAISQSAHGLTGTTLPQVSRDAAVARLLSIVSGIHHLPHKAPPRAFGALSEWIVRYMSGERQEFPVPLDLSGRTAFQSRVWHATRDIPYGETRTYSWVAAQSGHPTARRAVGQALNRNPFPIVVPCHRVIGADGTLTGFGGGIETKQQLLVLEGAGEFPSYDGV